MTSKNENGFTLVEIVVSILVIGVIVAFIVSLFSSIQLIQQQTSSMESATRAAQREMESLRNNNYSNLESGQTRDFTDKLPSNLNKGKGTVTIGEPDPGLKRVDIIVEYYEKDKKQEVKVSSLVGILGITQ